MTVSGNLYTRSTVNEPAHAREVAAANEPCRDWPLGKIHENISSLNKVSLHGLMYRTDHPVQQCCKLQKFGQVLPGPFFVLVKHRTSLCTQMNSCSMASQSFCLRLFGPYCAMYNIRRALVPIAEVLLSWSARIKVSRKAILSPPFWWCGTEGWKYDN